MACGLFPALTVHPRRHGRQPLTGTLIAPSSCHPLPAAGGLRLPAVRRSARMLPLAVPPAT